MSSRFSSSCPQNDSEAAFSSFLFTKCHLKITAHHLVADLTLGCPYLWVSMKSSLLSGLLFLMFTPGRKPLLLFSLKGDCKGENELVPVVALWCISGRRRSKIKKSNHWILKVLLHILTLEVVDKLFLTLSLSRTLQKMGVCIINNNLQGKQLNYGVFICWIWCRRPSPRRNDTMLWKCCITNYPQADIKFLFFPLQTGPIKPQWRHHKNISVALFPMHL